MRKLLGDGGDEVDYRLDPFNMAERQRRSCMYRRRSILYVLVLLLAGVIVPILSAQATDDLFPVNKVANCDYVEMRTPNNSQEGVRVSGELYAVALPGSILKSGELLTEEKVFFLAGMPDDPDMQYTAPGAWNGPTNSVLNEFVYFKGHVTGWIQVHSLNGELLDEEEWKSDPFECGEKPDQSENDCDSSLATWALIEHNKARVETNVDEDCLVAFGVYNTNGFDSLEDQGASMNLLSPPAFAIVSKNNRVVDLVIDPYDSNCKVQIDVVMLLLEPR